MCVGGSHLLLHLELHPPTHRPNALELGNRPGHLQFQTLCLHHDPDKCGMGEGCLRWIVPQCKKCLTALISYFE